MPPIGRIKTTITVGGVAANGTVSRTKEGQIGHELSLPAGSDGVQLAFTGVDDITVTMAQGYVIEDADTADVYWYVDGVLYVKYGATVALAGDIVTLSGGAGDDYVTGEGTLDMIVTKQVSIDTDFVGNAVEMMAAACDKDSHIEFRAAASSIAGVTIPAGEAWPWIKNGGYTNPLAGETVANIKASCGDADNAAVLRLGILYDSV